MIYQNSLLMFLDRNCHFFFTREECRSDSWFYEEGCGKILCDDKVLLLRWTVKEKWAFLGIGIIKDRIACYNY